MTYLTIERFSPRGEGVASASTGPVFVPFAVPGDTIEADVIGDRADIDTILGPSPDRVAPFCPYFTRCGGCATQSTALSRQLAWKRDLVVSALATAGVPAAVAACVDAHGAGRRRATFHARRGEDGRLSIGFMAARSHALVAIEYCPILAPGMEDAVPVAAMLAAALASAGKPMDIAVTATLAGLDVDMRGCGELDPRQTAALVRAAERTGVARVSNHGRVVVTFRPPLVRIGDTSVELPPGAFLQATQVGEEALAGLVMEATTGAKRIADLFSGLGTFALRLAARAAVHVAEENAATLEALLHAGRSSGPHPLTGIRRDLVRCPLAGEELRDFDAVVFDPPRAGAADQARELARSAVPLVVGVSCNPRTFAHDAKMLVAGGYSLEQVTPVDQFRHSAHVELVGVFRRVKAKRKRSLLG